MIIIKVIEFGCYGILKQINFKHDSTNWPMVGWYIKYVFFMLFACMNLSIF